MKTSKRVKHDQSPAVHNEECTLHNENGLILKSHTLFTMLPGIPVSIFFITRLVDGDSCSSMLSIMLESSFGYQAQILT